MSDYRESTVAGSRYVRCNRIHIDNPLGAVPTALFAEEEVLNIGDDDPIRRLISNVSVKFTDPTATIPLRDPTTWELTGETITMGELYAAIASVYWQAALDRDAREVNASPLE